MALKPQVIPPIPEETGRLARQIWPKGNRSLQSREELATIYTDELFGDLYPKLGSLAQAPWRLALVCVMQYMEGYTDRQAVLHHAEPHPLEVCAQSGTSGSWLRLFGALRVSQPRRSKATRKTSC